MSKKPFRPKKKAIVSQQPTIKTEGCQVVYSDIVNVSTSPDGVTFTFYKSVPDPAKMESKGVVLYALAIAQVPVEVGTQVPGFIIEQAIQRADMKAEEIELLIQETEKITGKFKQKLQEVRDGSNS